MSEGDLAVGQAGGVRRPAPSAAERNAVARDRHGDAYALGAGRMTPPKRLPALGAGLMTPPKRLTDRSPSFGVSLASTNTSETWVCDERGRPVGRASRRGLETRAERVYSPRRGNHKSAPGIARGPLNSASSKLARRVSVFLGPRLPGHSVSFTRRTPIRRIAKEFPCNRLLPSTKVRLFHHRRKSDGRSSQNRAVWFRGRRERPGVLHAGGFRWHAIALITAWE
jgi:hypothetical protein